MVVGTAGFSGGWRLESGGGVVGGHLTLEGTMCEGFQFNEGDDEER